MSAPSTPSSGSEIDQLEAQAGMLEEFRQRLDKLRQEKAMLHQELFSRMSRVLIGRWQNAALETAKAKKMLTLLGQDLNAHGDAIMADVPEPDRHSLQYLEAVRCTAYCEIDFGGPLDRLHQLFTHVLGMPEFGVHLMKLNGGAEDAGRAHSNDRAIHQVKALFLTLFEKDLLPPEVQNVWDFFVENGQEFV